MYSIMRHVTAYLLHGGLVSAEAMDGGRYYLAGLGKNDDVTWTIFRKNPRVQGGVEIVDKNVDLYVATVHFLESVWTSTIKEEGLQPKVQGKRPRPHRNTR